MTTRLLRRAVVALLCTASAASAQRRLAVADSSGVWMAASNRMLWRDMTLANGAALRGAAAFPLIRGLMLEESAMLALSNRSARSFGDQLTASLHYEIPVRGGTEPLKVILGASAIANPNLGARFPGQSDATTEATVTVLYTPTFPSLGVRTVPLRLDGAWDVGRNHAGWVHAAAEASIGTTFDHTTVVHEVQAVAAVGAAVSNMNPPTVSAPTPDFGFHSADVTLTLNYRRSQPVATYALSTSLELGGVVRPQRLGGNTFVVSLRQSVIFF